LAALEELELEESVSRLEREGDLVVEWRLGSSKRSACRRVEKTGEPRTKG
jgi:hypothetical protein